MLSDKSIERPWKPNAFERVLQNAKKASAKLFRKKKVNRLNERVNSRDFTIIASFCVGGVIYHDLGMQFSSPTVNLAFDGPDFVKFCSDLKGYLSKELTEVKTDAVPYPVGRLDDVEIRFVHYKTFEEAKKKWEERSRRVNFDKILVMACDRDGMGSPECMAQFDKLPYKKIMYTSKEHSEYDWAVYCPTFKNKNCVGVMTGCADFVGNKYYEKYTDIANFLN